MKKLMCILAAAAVVGTLGATAFATGATVDAKSASVVPAGIEVLAATSGAPDGSVVFGYMIDPETGNAYPVGHSPVDPPTGTAVLMFPDITQKLRLDLRGPGGALLASSSISLVDLFEQ